MNSLTNGEQAFILRLTRIVEANASNENFGVSELADELNISRSTLYFKVKSLTGKSASRYLREIRLNKARRLFEKEGRTVSEVAFEVGFSSPSYFSRCFHELFGYPPGEERKMHPAGPPVESDSVANIPVHQKKRLKRIGRFGIFALMVLIVAGALLFDPVWRRNSDLSIAVLPFKNMTNDIGNQYFADGLQEDILSNLSYIKSLRVAPRTSSDRFLNSGLSTRKMSRLMHVRYFIEGSVRHYDDKVRITIQLIDARKEDHLWSENYDRELGDVIGVQSKVALAVARQLKAVLSENEIRRIEKISTRNPQAYDNYMQARFLLHKSISNERSGFNGQGVVNSIPFYEKALAEDPKFAEAWAGLANANMQLSAWQIKPGREGFMNAWEMSRKAIELDPECGEAFAIQGAVTSLIFRDIEKGGELYRRSIELNPNFGTARQWYAQYLMITGPISAAREQINRALELEPYFWVVRNLDAWITYFEKDYERSLQRAEEARPLNPEFPDNMWLYFLNYVKLGRAELARDELKSITERYSGSGKFAAGIDSSFQAEGIKGLFTRMIEINRTSPIGVEGLNGDYIYLAWWNAILKNREQALFWLEQNLHYKRPDYHYFNLILFHPDFEFLHNEARFRAVADSLGLSAYWVNVDKN